MAKELKRNKDGTPRKRKESELTPGEIMLLKGLGEGKTITQAYSDALGSGLSPNHAGWVALNRIKKKAPEIMDELGLTQRALIDDYLKPLLNATEVKVFKSSGKMIEIDEDGNRQLVDADEIIYSKPLEALSIRKDALDMSMRIQGMYSRPEDGGNTFNQTNNVQIINHIERPKRELGPNVN